METKLARKHAIKQINDVIESLTTLRKDLSSWVIGEMWPIESLEEVVSDIHNLCDDFDSSFENREDVDVKESISESQDEDDEQDEDVDDVKELVGELAFGEDTVDDDE